MQTTAPAAPGVAAPAVTGYEAHRKEPLAGAFFWVLAFMAVYCGRPEDYIPGVAHLHPALIVGACALTAFVLSLGHLKKGLPREIILLVLLLIQLGLASVLSPVFKAHAVTVTIEFSKAVLIIVVMVLAVTTFKRFRKLLFIQTAAVAVIAAASVAKGVRNGGRLYGVLNGIYANPNDLAIAQVLCLPICLFFLFRSRRAAAKLAWLGASLVMVYCVFLTASRAGFLALIIIAAVCLWEFGVKGGRRYLIPLAMLCVLLLVAFAGHNTRQRLASTFSSQSDYEHAHGSAMARKRLLILSLKVTAEHPIFGIGPGDFRIISGQWNETHNVYTALSAEAGLPALFLFLAIYWCSFVNLREAIKRVEPGSEVFILAQAIRASLIAFAPAAFFFPDAYQYFVYFMFAYSTLILRVSSREAAGPAAGSTRSRTSLHPGALAKVSTS
ncbi:MAG: O-antigen ligase family protein [Terriglobia bacterium]